MLNLKRKRKEKRGKKKEKRKMKTKTKRQKQKDKDKEGRKIFSPFVGSNGLFLDIFFIDRNCLIPPTF